MQPTQNKVGLFGERERILPVIILLLAGLSSILNPAFLSVQNLGNILLDASLTATVGLGMTMVMVSGGIDVSVGSGVALTAAFVGKALLSGASGSVVTLIALAVGALVGLVNGLGVLAAKVHPIIVTLATLNLYRSLTYITLGGRWLVDMPPLLRPLAVTRPLGIPAAAWIVIGAAVVLSVFLRRHRFGRYVYALGSNEEAARLAGVRVDLVRVTVYVGTGLLVGVGALIYIGRTGVVQTNSLTGFELSVIAATVLGGTSTTGGRGTPFGTIMGAVLVAILRNAMVLLRVPALWEGALIGVLILLAVMADLFQRRSRQ